MFGVTLEGEVVERQHARNVYRYIFFAIFCVQLILTLARIYHWQILHTPKDPALLQQDQGNRFSTRVCMRFIGWIYKLYFVLFAGLSYSGQGGVYTAIINWFLCGKEDENSSCRLLTCLKWYDTFHFGSCLLKKSASYNQYNLSAFVMPMPNETVTIGSPLQQVDYQEIFPAPGEERVYRFHETSIDLQPQRGEIIFATDLIWHRTQ